MDIVIFIFGVVFGAGTVLAVQLFNRKATDAMFEQMKLNFENTANSVVQSSSANLSEINKEKLEEFFTRFKEKLEDFERHSNENFKNENDNFTKFDTNIKQFIEAGNKIAADTSNLLSVMRSDNKTSGHWGEIVLEKVLETSGLRAGEEYDIQKNSQEGRPDATICLPENRCIYIDSKTSFNSWYNYSKSENEEEKKEFLKQFIDSTKNHIKGLKGKYYTDEKSPDYVLMFIPIESCYSMMFYNNNELWDLAWKNNVMPVSPTTLLAALKIINIFHQQDRQNKNIKEMASICANVYDKFASLLEELLKVKKDLNSALTKLQGKGNILYQIDKIKALGGPTSKNIPQIEQEAD